MLSSFLNEYLKIQRKLTLKGSVTRDRSLTFNKGDLSATGGRIFNVVANHFDALLATIGILSHPELGDTGPVPPIACTHRVSPAVLQGDASIRPLPKWRVEFSHLAPLHPALAAVGV